MAQTKRKKRKNRRFPAPPPRTQSARRYVRVAPKDIALFRFLLEAVDNLALFTVCDRRTGALMLRYSPDQADEVHTFLVEARTQMDIDDIPLPEPGTPVPEA